MTNTDQILSAVHERIAKTVETSEEWSEIRGSLEDIFENKLSDYLIAACAFLIDTLEFNGLQRGLALAVLAYHSGIDVEMTFQQKDKQRTTLQ